MILGSTTPPGRMHRALDGAIERAAARGTGTDLLDLGNRDFEDGKPGERAEDALDQLFAATVEAAAALAGTAAGLEPSPLAAKAIRPRSGSSSA